MHSSMRVVFATVVLLCGAKAHAEVETLYTFGAPFGDEINGLSAGRNGSVYVTAAYGGDFGFGTVVRRERCGRLTTVHSFAGGAEGASPSPGVAIDDAGNLYGTTSRDGAFGYGTAYRISACGRYEVLHDFSPEEGGASRAPLLLASDGNLYGTTAGIYVTPESFFPELVMHRGAVFRLSRSGEFSVLHEFAEPEGAQPLTGLIQANDGHLYGTTSSLVFAELVRSPRISSGTIFRITLAGEFTNLHVFDGRDGANPLGRLAQASDGWLYGTSASDGDVTWSTFGTVFRISTEGVFETVWNFGVDQPAGWSPRIGLVEGTDGRLYGTTNGYPNARGTFFAISRAGEVTPLYSFGPQDGPAVTELVPAADGGWYIGSERRILHVTEQGEVRSVNRFGYPEGLDPLSGVTLGDDGAYYGATTAGGPGDGGTLFRLTADGRLATLHAFEATNEQSYGATPPSPLMLSTDGSFYGTTGGGIADSYALYRLTPSGEFTVLFSFDSARTGEPAGKLLEGRDGHVYGVASSYEVKPYVYRFERGTRTLTKLAELSDGESYVRLTGALIQGVDGAFYGTGSSSSATTSGVAFRVAADGTFSTLYAFPFGPTPQGVATEGLVQAADGTFYGSTLVGGAAGGGTVFALDAAGELRVLHAFAPSDGAGWVPRGPLLLNETGDLYGQTHVLLKGPGDVFAIRADGTYESLGTLAGGPTPAGLIRGADGRIYGTRSPRAASDRGGFVFAVDP